MNFLTTPDYIVIFTYLAVSLLIGLYFTRRAGQNVESFFLAGRSLPWWVLGVSMAATTFAADTPLAITDLTRSGGIWANWFWWSWGIGWVLSSYLIAPLWRRSEVTTDAGIIELRYDRGARLLRRFSAVYFGIVLNTIIIGWVVGAMSVFLTVLTGWQLEQTALALMALALLYTVFSGLWGVVYTDLLQFIIALIGTVYLAVHAVDQMPVDWGQALAKIRAEQPGRLDIIPEGAALYWGFFFFLFVQWWAFYQSSLNVYFAQRIGAARTVADARRASLFFNALNFSLRHWPWLVVAVVSMILWPTAADIAAKLNSLNIEMPAGSHHQAAFALVMTQLPPVWLGLVLVALLAAFMSTVDTHLNWGASYIISDLYLPYRRRKKRKQSAHSLSEEKLQVLASRIAMVCLFMLAVAVALVGESVASLWQVLYGMTAGLGFVYLLRWFWTRVNAWAELGAMVTGILGTLVFWSLGDDWPATLEYWGLAEEAADPLKIIIITAASILVTLVLCFFAPAVSPEKLGEFRRKIRPALWFGPGAGADSATAGEDPDGNKLIVNPPGKTKILWPAILLGLVAVYGLMFGLYFVLFGDGLLGTVIVTASLGAFFLESKLSARLDF